MALLTKSNVQFTVSIFDTVRISIHIYTCCIRQRYVCVLFAVNDSN